VIADLAISANLMVGGQNLPPGIYKLILQDKELPIIRFELVEPASPGLNKAVSFCPLILLAKYGEEISPGLTMLRIAAGYKLVIKYHAFQFGCPMGFITR